MNDQHLRAAHEAGSHTAHHTYEEIIYGDLVPSWMWDDHAASVCFEAGRRGLDFPVYATGWRYGSIPASGCSHNYREGAAEAGLSVMQLDGGEKVKTLAELRGSFASRPVVRVAGWVHPYEVGGDGEPLLIGAVELP